ncbi:MAG: peptide MFS transporter [Flavobacteriales bacterium]
MKEALDSTATNSGSKHPRALPYLFFSEMWERFGYYLMIGILVIYMKDTEKGGLGFDNAKASDIFGTFIALVFLTPFIGGLLADRILGLRISITIGGILMGLGYIGLSLPGETAFFVSLGFIAVGNGFFKPNISTLLGNVYNESKYIELKSTGYNIFYFGINIGAFICNFFAAWLRNTYGFDEAFIAAGVGMFLGVIIFWVGSKSFKHADVIKPMQPEDMSLPKIFATVFMPMLLAGFMGWIIPGNIFGSDSTDAFIIGAMPVVGFYISILVRSSAQDRKPLSALMVVFCVSVVFWTIFKQNGTALTVWADKHTDRELPGYLETPADKLKLMETVKYEKGMYQKVDEQFRTSKDEKGAIIKVESYPNYFVNRTEPIQEGQALKLINTEIFQSVNPGFVLLLTPVVVWFWLFLRRRKKEPEIGGKLVLSMVFTGLSAVCMVGSVWVNSNGYEKASPMWLIGAYGIITLGELCLSPVGLYRVSKLSPPRLTALMMGGWFVSSSLGNKMSGVLAAMWDNYHNKWLYFGLNAILAFAAAIGLLFLVKWLNNIISSRL